LLSLIRIKQEFMVYRQDADPAHLNIPRSIKRSGSKRESRK
jgi:hypothetical protein